MSKQLFLLPVLVAALAACASSPRVPRDARSENFDVTARYLDLGGQVYAYMDVEGDVVAAAELMNEVIAVVDEIPPQYKARVDAVGIAKKLGLTDVQAIGMSSYKEGDRFINKSFVKTAYPRTGLMRYFGEDPHPFEILQMAPADAMFAFETDVNLQAFLDTLYLVLQDVADPGVIEDVNRHLDSPVVPGAMTFRELMSQLNTKMMGAVSFHPTRRMRLPDTDIEMPVVEAFFAVDNMGPVMDILMLKARELPIFSVWEDAEWQRIGVAEFLTAELLDYRPVIWRHIPTQRLYIATDSAYLDKCLQMKDGLGQSDVFQQLSASLPVQSGNSVMYVSPEVYNSVVVYVDKALAKEEKLTSIRKVLGVLAAKVSPGQVWMSQNTPDGIYQVSSSTFSHKLTLMGSVYLSQIYAASILGFAGQFVFDGMLHNLFGGIGDSPAPAEPSYPEEMPQEYPEDGSDETPENPSGSQLNNGTQMAPGQNDDSGDVPEYVDEFMKKWKERHPGAEI
ncbi:MAG: hypothetical protein JXX14_13315 [Deltaproteobacteria bacterium]|nr:hypothetical protein [Deltaproteobacteria bacterium]